MATTYTGNDAASAYDDEITIPQAGDQATVNSVNLPLQQLADNTAALRSVIQRYHAGTVDLTWTKPDNAMFIEFVLVGGGESGEDGSGSTAGRGGASAQPVRVSMWADAVPSTLTIVIGAGGTSYGGQAGNTYVKGPPGAAPQINQFVLIAPGVNNTVQTIDGVTHGFDARQYAEGGVAGVAGFPGGRGQISPTGIGGMWGEGVSLGPAGGYNGNGYGAGGGGGRSVTGSSGGGGGGGGYDASGTSYPSQASGATGNDGVPGYVQIVTYFARQVGF